MDMHVTVRARGVTAVYTGKGRWAVRGRGPKRSATHDEVRALLWVKDRREDDERKHPR